MEIKRERIDPTHPPEDFRAKQLLARDMLRGDLEGEALDRYVEQRVMTTTLEKAVAWSQGNSLYPMTFGLACCAIEMMSIVGARVDIARFGWEAFRASPRQADLLILSGRVSVKMAPVIRRIYDQMLEPKWAISMGACCSSMGVFNNYALVPSDKFMPIDVHVPGCPPRPEALMHGILRLRDKIHGHSPDGWRERYDAVGTEEVLVNGDGDAAGAINVFPGRGQPPVPDATGLELTAHELRDHNAESILGTDFQRGRAVLLAAPQYVTEVLGALKRKGYGFLASLHGVDYYPEEPRLGVLYELLNMHEVDRITVKMRVSTDDPRVHTATELFPGAEFPEREVYDMFGVVFEGHPDLRRILMPEDFEGFPQRRDFPIGGEPVLFTYNEEKSYGKWQ